MINCLTFRRKSKILDNTLKQIMWCLIIIVCRSKRTRCQWYETILCYKLRGWWDNNWLNFTSFRLFHFSSFSTRIFRVQRIPRSGCARLPYRDNRRFITLTFTWCPYASFKYDFNFHELLLHNTIYIYIFIYKKRFFLLHCDKIWNFTTYNFSATKYFVQSERDSNATILSLSLTLTRSWPLTLSHSHCLPRRLAFFRTPLHLQILVRVSEQMLPGA